MHERLSVKSRGQNQVSGTLWHNYNVQDNDYSGCNGQQDCLECISFLINQTRLDIASRFVNLLLRMRWSSYFRNPWLSFDANYKSRNQSIQYIAMQYSTVYCMYYFVYFPKFPFWNLILTLQCKIKPGFDPTSYSFPSTLQTFNSCSTQSDVCQCLVVQLPTHNKSKN